MEKKVGGRRRTLRREETRPILGLGGILSPNGSKHSE